MLRRATAAGSRVFAVRTSAGVKPFTPPLQSATPWRTSPCFWWRGFHHTRVTLGESPQHQGGDDDRAANREDTPTPVEAAPNPNGEEPTGNVMPIDQPAPFDWIAALRDISKTHIVKTRYVTLDEKTDAVQRDPKSLPGDEKAHESIQEAFRKHSGKLPKLRHRITRKYDDVDKVTGKITKIQMLALFTRRRQEQQGKQPQSSNKQLAEWLQIAEEDIELIFKFYSADPLRQPDSASDLKHQEPT